MGYQAIGIGSAANDNTGDVLRTAYTKINANFVEQYGFNDRGIKAITKAAHGFIVGRVLTLDGTGTHVAVSNSLTDIPVGIVSTVVDANNFIITQTGYIDTLSGLVAGTTYYVQNTGFLSPTVSSLRYLIATTTTAGYILLNSKNTNLTLSQVLAIGNDAGGLKIVNLADPISPQDAATRAWVLTQTATPTLAAVVAAGQSAGGLKITSLGTPTVSTDAATKGYVDATSIVNPNLSTVLGIGNDAGARKIINLLDPVNPQDAATRAWTLSQIITPNLQAVLTAGNSAGSLRITNLLDPVNPQDAATRAWVLSVSGSAAWLLASGGTLTGVNTITSNANGQLNFNGTWTAAGNSNFHANFTGSLTGRAAQAADVLTGYQFTPTLTTGTNGQTLNAVTINPSFSGTGTFNVLALQNAGTPIVTINSSGLSIFTSAGRFGSYVEISPGGANRINIFSGGGGLGLDIYNNGNSNYLFAFNDTTGTGQYYSNQSKFPLSMYHNGVNAVSIATQTSSRDFNFVSSLWNTVGPTEVKGWFSWRSDASTVTSLAQALTLYQSTGATPGFSTPVLSINSSGQFILGGVTPTNASVLLDLQSTTLALKVSAVTNIASVATPANGMVTYDATTNLFNFRQNGAWVTGIGGGGGGWLLSSGGTLTGVNTIASNANGQLNFNGTWTAAGNSNFHAQFGGTFTSRNTASDNLYGYIFNPTLNVNAGAPASQVLTGLWINPTFTGTATYAPLTVSIAGTEHLTLLDNFTLRYATGQSNAIMRMGDLTQIGRAYIGTYAGGSGIPFSIKLQNVSETSFTFNDSSIAGGSVSYWDLGVYQNGANSVSTATQRNSQAFHYRTSLWNGSAETKGWFSWRTDASTVTSLAQALTLYQSTGVSPGFSTPVLSINSLGQFMLGGVTPTNASVLLDLQSTTLALKVSAVTNIASVATPANGMVTYDAATNLFNFRQNGVWANLGSGVVQTVTVTLTNGQIASGNTSPVVVIAAPGAGKVIQVISALTKIVFGSAAWATNITYRYQYSGAASGISGVQPFDQSSTSYNVESFPGLSGYALATIENKAIEFFVQTGNPTGGTGGSIVVQFQYIIKTL